MLTDKNGEYSSATSMVPQRPTLIKGKKTKKQKKTKTKYAVAVDSGQVSDLKT